MKKFLNIIGIKLLPGLVNILIKTLKIKIHNEHNGKSNCIHIFWHSQMLIGWWLFKDKKSAALVSQSKDGDILNNILIKWNYKVIRGSSSKGGKDALLEMIKSVKDDYSAVITPDGPRGPANEFKNGALIISNKTDVPIVPVKIIFHKKKVLSKSWDKFQIPLPFSECDIFFGEKYYYKDFLEEDELGKLKKTISNEM